MGELTQAIKLQVFSDGGHPTWDAEFPAPPVTTARWKPRDWVTWVDHNGTWFVKDERYHYNRKREYLLELT